MRNPSGWCRGTRGAGTRDAASCELIVTYCLDVDRAALEASDHWDRGPEWILGSDLGANDVIGGEPDRGVHPPFLHGLRTGRERRDRHVERSIGHGDLVEILAAANSATVEGPDRAREPEHR